MKDPREIKDVPCSVCGTFVPEDELADYDWDYNLCYDCKDKD
jgi:hypothetical protein